ncbi:MAG TPA: DUF2961 domain-containing protein [Polyangiaceae bacterium]|nr:DUF2961 domain-containing protein [Polyangiaceae bacterium]
MLAFVACGAERSPDSAIHVRDGGLAIALDATQDLVPEAGAEEDSSADVEPAAVGSLTAPEGDEALTAVDGLPLLDLDPRSRHASSYDRSGGNSDWGNGVGVDAAGDQILLDARGPGCVYRIWFTGFADTDRIHMYFDDEPTARVDMLIGSFFGGQVAPFTAPLVGNGMVSSGGFFSYVPMPFATSLRITATMGSNYYYNIDFHSLPTDASVTTWTGAEDLGAARSVWAAAGAPPSPSAAATEGVDATVDLAPGATQVLFDGDGPAELASIEMNLPGFVRAPGDAGMPDATATGDATGLADGPLQALWMSMSWDGESTPSVLAPIGSLFALGNLRPTASGGLMAGVRADGTFYLYFPMPYAKHAHVELANHGPSALQGATVRVGSRAFPYSFDTVGTFATAYSEGTSVPGADLPLLDTVGSGKVVGVVLTEARAACGQQCTIRNYLEGDERVMVDGARTPVVLGTGTEDFFNGGFYFDQGPFGLPTHGNVAHDSEPAVDATSAYRFFVSDPILYRDYLRLSLQHGPADDVAVQAATLVYYYRQQRARLEFTDGFVVGDSTGESAHQYHLTNQTWSGSITGTFEGEFDSQSMTSTGRSHTGSSFFVMRVDPANRGVVLRRLFDQATVNQRATVIVDGTAVGDWLTPGGNAWHLWREEDFAIPASATSGKSSLSIEIRFVSSNTDWNEFEYQALSQLP